VALTNTKHADSPPSATTLAARRGEIRALTGLRLFAAAWVVAFHFQFTPGVWLSNALTYVRPVIGPGSLGVDLFYVLSGFVIALTYLERLGPRLSLRSASAFLWARVSRIWPVFVVLTNLFGVFLLAKYLWGASGHLTFQTVQPELTPGLWLLQMLMVQLWTQPYIDGSSWIGPAWSISAEWLAYVLFPVTALLYFRMAKFPKWLLGLLAVVIMLPMALLTGKPYFPYSWLLRIGAGFTSGVLVYLTVRHVRLTERLLKGAATLAAAMLAMIFVGLLLDGGMGDGSQVGIVLLLFPILVGALALSPGCGVARLLSSEWTVQGGRISYSLYLVHMAVFEVVWTAMLHCRATIGVDTPQSIVLALVGLVAAFVAAHLLWRYVEEPARAWSRRLTSSSPDSRGRS